MSSGTYSVPSRLIGVEVDVRLYTDHAEVYYKGHLVESMERIRGAGEARIDYRDTLGSLVRKPGAFTVCRVWSVPRQPFLPDASIDFAGLTPYLTVDSALRSYDDL